MYDSYRENFEYPYTATSATDFWRKWHIPLDRSAASMCTALCVATEEWHLQIFSCLVPSLAMAWRSCNFIMWGGAFKLGFPSLIRRMFPAGCAEKSAAVCFAMLPPVLIALSAGRYSTSLPGVCMGHFFGVLFGGQFTQAGGSTLPTRILQEPCMWVALRHRILPARIWHCYPLDDLDLHPRCVLDTRNRSFCGCLGSVAFALVGKSYNPFLYFRF